MQQFMETMVMEHPPTKPYYPETNTKIERFHRTIKILRKLVNNHANDWEDKLGQALWAHKVSS